MRTHGWIAKNAPTGPAMVLRCSCGEVLKRLVPGERVTTNKAVEVRNILCSGCGKSTKARIENGAT